MKLLMNRVVSKLNADEIGENNFITSSNFLRSSLAYFEEESEFELRSGDGLEEFIFAIYEIER